MESVMLHAEMVLVVPVIAFTFVVMGWIVSVFRGYLRQRDVMVSDWQERPAAAVRQDNAPRKEIHAEAA
jgi:hypothetical protein